jgi:hypothetical protein
MYQFVRTYRLRLHRRVVIGAGRDTNLSLGTSLARILMTFTKWEALSSIARAASGMLESHRLISGEISEVFKRAATSGIPHHRKLKEVRVVEDNRPEYARRVPIIRERMSQYASRLSCSSTPQKTVTSDPVEFLTINVFWGIRRVFEDLWHLPLACVLRAVTSVSWILPVL